MSNKKNKDISEIKPSIFFTQINDPNQKTGDYLSEILGRKININETRLSCALLNQENTQNSFLKTVRNSNTEDNEEIVFSRTNIKSKDKITDDLFRKYHICYIYLRLIL